MSKISFIVPTYNRKKTIKRCIDSLINQSIKDIEIIIIDDGSTDNTKDIIDKYTDKRIKYYKRSNHGIGSSRNFGIDKASGEYLAFIDSDDYVDKDFAKLMIKNCEEQHSDMAVCDYYEFDDNNNLNKVHIKTFIPMSLKKDELLILKINYGPCNKIYRSKLIKDNNIRFPEDLKYEDLPFISLAIKYSKRIVKVDLPLHYYYQNNSGETKTIDDRIYDIFKDLDIIRKDYKDEYPIALLNLISLQITTYTMKERYVKDENVRNKFIDEAFDYLHKYAKGYRKAYYFKTISFKRRIIKKSKLLTKIYCSIYSKLY